MRSRYWMYFSSIQRSYLFRDMFGFIPHKHYLCLFRPVYCLLVLTWERDSNRPTYDLRLDIQTTEF